MNLRTEGLRCGVNSWPDLRVNAGEALGLLVRTNEDAALLCDTLMGLVPPDRGRVFWDDIDLAAQTEREAIARLAQGIAITPMGDLLANLNLEENILLPAHSRRPAAAVEARRRLHDWLGKAGGKFGLDEGGIFRLPYELSRIERVGAALLRAAITRPVCLFVGNIFEDLELKDRNLMWGWLGELRRDLSDSIWIFLSTVGLSGTSFAFGQVIESR